MWLSFKWKHQEVFAVPFCYYSHIHAHLCFKSGNTHGDMLTGTLSWAIIVFSTLYVTVNRSKGARNLCWHLNKQPRRWLNEHCFGSVRNKCWLKNVLEDYTPGAQHKRQKAIWLHMGNAHKHLKFERHPYRQIYDTDMVIANSSVYT